MASFYPFSQPRNLLPNSQYAFAKVRSDYVDVVAGVELLHESLLCLCGFGHLLLVLF
ncbi:hypothetical protein [Caballeronia sp. M23-90]